MKKKNRIKRGDYNRVLITETLPFETPIIFTFSAFIRLYNIASLMLMPRNTINVLSRDTDILFIKVKNFENNFFLEKFSKIVT